MATIFGSPPPFSRRSKMIASTCARKFMAATTVGPQNVGSAKALNFNQKEANLEYTAALENVNEDLVVLSEKEAEFLPITTKAYLYLSGTPFRALATGEFIEEQIFNW